MRRDKVRSRSSSCFSKQLFHRSVRLSSDKFCRTPRSFCDQEADWQKKSPLVFYRLSLLVCLSIFHSFISSTIFYPPASGFDENPAAARVSLSMNPSAALPKAAALPARLLRTPPQCSKQSPGPSICLSGQKRGYYAAASASPARRLREGVYKKKTPAALSVRVGGILNPDLQVCTHLPCT